jgi:Na+-driven multidrug efflux pump
MAPIQQEINDWTWTRTWRFGGVAGIIFVILAVVGFIAVPPEIPPVYDDPVAEIETFFTDNDTAYLVGDYIGAIGFVIFFLIFVVNLSGVLRSAEGTRAPWSTLALVGGVVGLAFGGVAAFFWNALALQAASDGNDAIVQTLMYLQFVTDSSIPLVMALLVFGSSVVIIRTGVLWK